MTVKELIIKLQTFPPNCKILMRSDGGFVDICPKDFSLSTLRSLDDYDNLDDYFDPDPNGITVVVLE